MSTLLLTATEVANLSDAAMAVDATHAAFEAFGQHQAIMPPKVYLEFPDHDGDFRAMPAAMQGAAGIKWVNSHPSNPAKHGLPSVMGLFVLSDPDTAVPLAVMDATLLTALRTGAAAAVATRALARPGARTLGIVGAGVQAHHLIASHNVLHDWDIVVADRNPEAAARIVDRWGGRVGTVEEAAGCDVVCTATPSRQPVLEDGWVQPGAHVNAMGADAEGKQELPVSLLKRARVFWADEAQASHSGEVNVGLHEGSLTRSDIAGGLGDVIEGRLEGRQSEAQSTVFDSTGLAVQDLSLASRIVAAARAAGVGHEIAFRS